jgi:hypothetical protein
MAKPRKVGEPAGTYAAKMPATKAAPGQPVIRYAKLESVKKTNEKLMQVHHEVLKKLAQ